MSEERSIADVAGPSSPTALGVCVQCHGGLCTRGGVVSCSYCNLDVPEHPVSVAERLGRAALKPVAAIYPKPQEYAHTLADRLLVLEHTVREQAARIAALEMERGLQSGRKSR